MLTLSPPSWFRKSHFFCLLSSFVTMISICLSPLPAEKGFNTCQTYLGTSLSYRRHRGGIPLFLGSRQCSIQSLRSRCVCLSMLSGFFLVLYLSFPSSLSPLLSFSLLHFPLSQGLTLITTPTPAISYVTPFHEHTPLLPTTQSFSQIHELALFCDPFHLTRAICVTTRLELCMGT